MMTLNKITSFVIFSGTFFLTYGAIFTFNFLYNAAVSSDFDHNLSL